MATKKTSRSDKTDEPTTPVGISLDALFAAMSDVVIVFDGDGRCLQIAPTSPNLLYSQPEETVGRLLHDIMPAEQADTFVAHIREALASQSPKTIEYPMEIQGHQLWFSAVISPMSADTVLYVARDITERVNASQLLEQAVEERTRELAALVQTANAITSTLEVGPLMESLLDNLKSVIDYDGVGVSMREGNYIRQLAVRRPPGYPTGPDVGPSVERIDSPSEHWQLVMQGKSFIIDDTHGPAPIAKAYRKSWGGDFTGTAGEYIRCLAVVPLMARSEVTGLMTIASSEPNHFTERHLELLRGVADIAASAIENARLFEETQRRTKELSALLEVSSAVASSLDLSDVLGGILDQLGAITKHSGSAILLARDDAFEIVEARSITGVHAEVGARIPFAAASVLTAAMRRGETVIIDDIRADEPLAADYRAAINSIGLLDQPPFDVIRSWMAVPLALKDRVIGMLTLSWTAPAYFTTEHAQLAKAFADQAAIAMENSRLYDQARKSAREFEVLSRADTELFRSLDLDSVLQSLVDVTIDMLGAEKSLVATWDADSGQMSLRAWRNLSSETLTVIRDMYARMVPRMDDSGVIVTEDPSLAHPEERPIIKLEGIRSFIQVPVVSPLGRPLGFFSVAYTRERHFTQGEQDLLTALADRAAVAIGNADLYQRAQRAASLEERQRLARELHDSVSQALYGIALGARTAQTLLERDPKKASEPVDYVLSLAEAGLAEMRALIFELRPESLESEGLTAAIRKQAEAVQARHGISIEFRSSNEPDLPLATKEAAYRITQEALTNVIKHSQATEVRVTLASDGEGLELEVADNGAGFDATGDFPGHLGLHSMKERAEKSGGRLEICSEPGAGTRVIATFAVR
jgi:PAS domain S-box-containing protein